MAAVDISVLGERELSRALGRLQQRMQRTVVRRGLRKAAVKVKAYVLQNVSGGKLDIRSGRTLAAFRGAKIRAFSDAQWMRVGYMPPTREELGIKADDPNYYPFAIEYGHITRGDSTFGNRIKRSTANIQRRRQSQHRVPARPFIRPAVDEHRGELLNVIAEEIRRGVNEAFGA